jgi:hypothetical protein
MVWAEEEKNSDQWIHNAKVVGSIPASGNFFQIA